MNYQLAKELQNAGFKVPPHSDDDRGCYNDCHVPTLEELIEACGDDFLSLFKELKNVKSRGYQARSDTDFMIITHGLTPSEAVARLWLELNK